MRMRTRVLYNILLLNYYIYYHKKTCACDDCSGVFFEQEKNKKTFKKTIANVFFL